MRSSLAMPLAAAVVLASAAAAQFVALDASDAVTFYVAGVPSGEAHPDAELARWALDAWSNATDGALSFVETEKASDAAIRIYWAGPGSAKYGEMLAIEVDGKPGAMIFVNTATEELGEDIHARAQRDRLFRDTVVYLTCVHELGHSVGLTHTDRFEDIMYSFQHGGDIQRYFLRYRKQLMDRGDLRRLSPFSNNDLARLRELY
jgi:hypothetical protein